MKKFLAMIIATVMTACFFAGCFGKKEASVKTNPEKDISARIDKYLELVYEGNAEALEFVEDGSGIADLTNNALTNRAELTQYLKAYIGAPDADSEAIDVRIAEIVEEFYSFKNYSVGEIVLNNDKNATVSVCLFSPDMDKIGEKLASIKVDDLIKENADIDAKIKAGKKAEANEIALELVNLLLDEAFDDVESLIGKEDAEIKLGNVGGNWMITEIVSVEG